MFTFLSIDTVSFYFSLESDEILTLVSGFYGCHYIVTRVFLLNIFFFQDCFVFQEMFTNVNEVLLHYVYVSVCVFGFLPSNPPYFFFSSSFLLSSVKGLGNSKVVLCQECLE